MAWLVEIEIPAEVGSEVDLFVEDQCTFTEIDPTWTNRNNYTVLTTPVWDALIDSMQVYTDACRIIDTLNQKLRSDSPLQPKVKVGSYIWCPDPTAPGGYRRSVVALFQTGTIQITGFAAKVLINGHEQAPSRTRGLRARELAARNESFAAALAIFTSAGEDIRTLWLAFEHVRKSVGYRPELGVPQRLITAFGETANKRHRHISNASLTYPEVSGAEARDLVQRLLNSWLDKENPH